MFPFIPAIKSGVAIAIKQNEICLWMFYFRENDKNKIMTCGILQLPASISMTHGNGLKYLVLNKLVIARLRSLKD